MTRCCCLINPHLPCICGPVYGFRHFFVKFDRCHDRLVCAHLYNDDSEVVLNFENISYFVRQCEDFDNFVKFPPIVFGDFNSHSWYLSDENLEKRCVGYQEIFAELFCANFSEFQIEDKKTGNVVCFCPDELMHLESLFGLAVFPEPNNRECLKFDIKKFALEGATPATARCVLNTGIVELFPPRSTLCFSKISCLQR